MSEPAVQLRSRLTCPHCWTEFPPEEVLWISGHSDLRGDPLLGQDEQQRFLPSRFDASGKAIDVKGVACKDLACPHCHLGISWALLETRPLFVSILGAPGSGKSYLLATMTWQLRQTLRDRFALNFGDADPICNQVLSDYEEKLFLSAQEDRFVYLRKTELEGDLYQSVHYGEREVWYPRPFVFSVHPMEGHLDYKNRRLLSRALCLYDNAGEHFLPGADSDRSPSRHLALSEVLLFLFDPTQHPKFRKLCKGRTNDPQMGDHGWSHRQDQVLLEAANRVRKHTGWSHSEKYKHPLVVVLTKFDAWLTLAGGSRLELSDVVRKSTSGMCGLDLQALQTCSAGCRALLMQLAPEVVAAADGFAKDVIYIPVSALGRGPEVVDGGALGIRPRDVKPMWAEVPMLYALHKATKGLVCAAARRAELAPAGSPEVSPAAVPERPRGSSAALPAPAPELRETGT